MNDTETYDRIIARIQEEIDLIHERMAEYVVPTDVPLALVKQEREACANLEMYQKLRHYHDAPVPDDLANRPASERIREVWVDRDQERRLFGQMLFGKTSIHIFLIEAESGMGKSILLKQFWDISSPLKSRARVDFRPASRTPCQVLDEISKQIEEQVGSAVFTVFNAQLKKFVVDWNLNVLHEMLMVAELDAALSKKTPEEQDLCYRRMTDAFLVDLLTLHGIDGRPVVILFDTFEKALSNTKTWLSKHFLPSTRSHPWLACVVAGQSIPQMQIDDDNEWCLQHQLTRLSDEHSREYIQKVTLTENEEMIKFITWVSKGKPLALQALVLDYLEGVKS